MVLDGAMTDTLDPAAATGDLPIRRPNDNPYLAGNLAPVTNEVTAFDLPTNGQIPAELEGRWLRNGPNPEAMADPSKHHWFLGNGMVHGVRLRGGNAEWYRNRFVLGAAELCAPAVAAEGGAPKVDKGVHQRVVNRREPALGRCQRGCPRHLLWGLWTGRGEGLSQNGQEEVRRRPGRGGSRLGGRGAAGGRGRG